MLRGNNLTKALYTKRLKPDGSTYAVAAGTSDCTSESIDIRTVARIITVRFLLLLGAITSGAVTSIKVQQAEDDGAGSPANSWADLEGSAYSIADTDDDAIVAVEITNPEKPHLRLIVDRGTQNAVIDGLIVELAGGDVPVTQPSTTIGNEIHVTPDEGTA